MTPNERTIETNRAKRRLGGSAPLTITLALALVLAPVALGATPAGEWEHTWRFVKPSQEPVKRGYCPVTDVLCGFSRTDFGASVAVDGGIAVVGEPHSSAVHVYEPAAVGWAQVATFTGADDFGGSVAVSGGFVLAGDPGASAVRVYARADGAWALVDALTVAGGGCLGRYVAVDGGLLAAADPCNGLVHAFEVGSGGWAEAGAFAGPDANVAVRPVDVGGGAVVVIVNGETWAHERAGAGWSATRVAATAGPVAAGDGAVAIGRINFGEVLVFARADGGWSQVATLRAEDAAPYKGFGGFGRSLALKGDTLVVGAPDEDASPGSPSEPDTEPDLCESEAGISVCVPERPGAVYVFQRADDGWAQAAKLTGDQWGDHRFGSAVALSDDAATLLVGAPFKYQSRAGSTLDVDPEDSVHVFSRAGEGD